MARANLKTLCRAKDLDVDGNEETVLARLINDETTVTGRQSLVDTQEVHRSVILAGSMLV